MKNEKKLSLLSLFADMLVISASTFGGGYVIIGMMKKKFCEQLHLITEEETMDMIALAQSAPGALAVNSAIVFGYRLRGIQGALTAALATVIPPLVIITLVTMVYDVFCSNVWVQRALQVMRAGVAAVVIDVALDLAAGIAKNGTKWDVALMIAAFAASWFLDISAVTIILLFLALGIARSILAKKEGL